MKPFTLLISVFLISLGAYSAQWEKVEQSQTFSELQKKLDSRLSSIDVFLKKSVKKEELLINSLKQLVYIIFNGEISQLTLKEGDKYFDIFSGEKNSLLRILEDHISNNPDLMVFEGNATLDEIFYDDYYQDFPPYYTSCPLAVIYDSKTAEALFVGASCKNIDIDYSDYE